ncbi:hypothetical protein GWI34_21455 [Actinomadura sp. DSM 109109]|nr:hypothetical protein [Actinomadura lepetitiana]
MRFFDQLSGLSDYFSIQENLSWTVVGRLTVEEAIRRLHGEPDTMARPAGPISDPEYDDLTDTFFLEQRGEAVIIVGFGALTAEALRRLSQNTVVHSVFWLINNYNRLSYAVDGTVVTELDILNPLDRWGTAPDALTDHLDALRALRDRPTPGPDWETAMATLESLTGQRLTPDWFTHPQLLVKVQ